MHVLIISPSTENINENAYIIKEASSKTGCHHCWDAVLQDISTHFATVYLQGDLHRNPWSKNRHVSLSG